MKEKLIKVLKMARKQMAVLICGTIVIAAVVFAYWPTQGWYADLASKVGASVSVAGQITALLKLPRNLPNVTANPNAPAQPLTVFPTQEVVAKGAAAVKTLGDQSQTLLNLAKQLNEHYPLTVNALPSGGDVDRDKFARDFKAAVEGDAYVRSWPPDSLSQVDKDYPIPALKAGEAPTPDEIAAKTAQIQTDVTHMFSGGAGGGQGNPQIAVVEAERTKGDLLQLYMDHANACKVYLEPGAIKPPTVYSSIKTATAPPPATDLWSAQLWLWVVEDAVTAVARANENAATVQDSPVKQIMDLTVKEPPYLVSGDPTVGAETTALTPAPDMTPSGRVCNGMYDVVQFSISLDVDADAVPQVLDALERAQFITILSVQCTAVDSSDRAMKGFVYGKARIAHLDLICEDLFLKSWTSKYCPTNSGPAAAAAAGATGTSSTNLLTVTVHGS